MSGRPRPLAQRFAEKVDKTHDSGCWVWTAFRDKHGYGVISMQSKSVHASRASWLIHVGPIPHGLWILHKCDNPACVNPDHLFLGTPKDNVDDMVAKGRQQRVRGEQKVFAKLSASKIEEMRQMRGHGLTYRAIGAAVGVNNATAFRAINGQAWQSMGDEVQASAIASHQSMNVREYRK